jgi:hypothetical protein
LELDSERQEVREGGRKAELISRSMKCGGCTLVLERQKTIINTAFQFSEFFSEM